MAHEGNLQNVMCMRPYITVLPILIAFFTISCTEQTSDAPPVDSTPKNNQPTYVATLMENGDTMVTVTSYYETGEVKCTQELIRGQRHGFEKFYFKNGILKYEVYYIGNQEWAVGQGHSIDGKVLDLGTLNFGTGSFKAYYDDGTPYSRLLEAR